MAAAAAAAAAAATAPAPTHGGALHGALTLYLRPSRPDPLSVRPETSSIVRLARPRPLFLARSLSVRGARTARSTTENLETRSSDFVRDEAPTLAVRRSPKSRAN